MFGVKKLAQRAKRAGCISQKVIFRISVESLETLIGDSIKADTLLSVCFERGGKISITSDVIWKSSNNTVVFGETLSMVVTMYQDIKSSNYLEKVGKIILRKKSKSRLGGEVFVGLGMCQVSLHEMMNEDYAHGKAIQFRIGLDTNGQSGSIILNTVIHSQLLGALVTDNDETMSMVSGFSDNECISAHFTTEIEHYSTRPNDTDTNDTELQSELTPRLHTVVGHASHCPALPPGKAVQAAEVCEPPDLSSHQHHNQSLTLAPLTAANISSMTSPHSPARTAERSPSLRDGLAVAQSTIATLQAQISAKDKLVATLSETATKQQETHNLQLTTLRADLKVAQVALQRERVGRNALASATDRGDLLIAETLARAREEAEEVAMQYAELAAELTQAYDDLSANKARLVLLEAENQSLLTSAQDSAAAAGAANMARAVVEDECNDIVQQLIAAKMHVASLSEQMDVALRSQQRSERHVLMYAARVSTLEVRAAAAGACHERADTSQQQQQILADEQDVPQSATQVL